MKISTRLADWQLTGKHVSQTKAPTERIDARPAADGTVTRAHLARAQVLRDLSSTNEVRLMQLPDGRRVVVKTCEAGIDPQDRLLNEGEARKEEVVHRLATLMGHDFVPRPTVLATDEGERSIIVTPDIDTGRTHAAKEAFHGIGDTDEGRTFLGRYLRDKLSVFDFIIGHGDRHDAWAPGGMGRGAARPARIKNVLIEKGGRMMSIDHEAAFSKPPFETVADAAVQDFFRQRGAIRDFKTIDFKRLMDAAFGELVGGDRAALDQLYRHLRIDVDGMVRRARVVERQFEGLLAQEQQRLKPSPSGLRRFALFRRAG